MNASETSESSPRVLHLILPDWRHLDTVMNKEEPFVLWPVGDQPLLYHWLDFALNEGYGKVVLYCTDRPDRVRKCMKESTLWGIDWSLQPVTEEKSLFPGSRRVDQLPWEKSLEEDTEPIEDWDLLRHWRNLENTWLKKVLGQKETMELNLSVGRYSRIHPTARLIQPCWIGDNVYIGEDCEIGPNAAIGNGCYLIGHSRVHDSRINPFTYLGPHTELDQVILDGNRLHSLKNKATLRLSDNFMAQSLDRKQEIPKVPLGDRIRARILLMQLNRLAGKLKNTAGKRSSETCSWTTFDGKKVMDEKEGHFLLQRRHRLKAVISGKLPLIGILPRDKRAFDALSVDWQDIIRETRPGFFSYADLFGFHEADGNEEEALHAVYQATQPVKIMRTQCLAGLKKMMTQLTKSNL